MKYKNKLVSLFLQFVKFGIVGVSNTLIGLFIYYALVFFNINYIIANTAGFICSVINAYYWNAKYVFKDNKKERSTVKSFIKVFISYGSTFLLGTGLLILWVDILHISDLVAPLINLCITIPLNFFLNKCWAMK